MTRTQLLGILAGVLLLPANGLAASPEQVCADCHGKDGASTESDVPVIAGQSEAYLKDQMNDYAGGERPCPQTKFRAGDKSRPATDMCKIAKALSPAEIQQLAASFAAKPFVRAHQKSDPAKAAIGKQVHKLHCEKCHAEGGTSKDDDAGILAGQWVPYLEHSLKEFADGTRTPPKKMKPKLEELTADDKAALLQYYGSVQ